MNNKCTAINGGICSGGKCPLGVAIGEGMDPSKIICSRERALYVEALKAIRENS